jgi:hypothetical protein
MSTRTKAAQPAKATAAKRTTKAAPKAEAPKGRQPVTDDATITKWVQLQLAAAAKRDESVSTAALLRAWRADGGQANPRRFAALVAGAR